MENIPENDILDATGKYNEEKQTWELEATRDSSSSLVTAFNPERPPTTCSQMTKVGHDHWISDRYVDD